MLSIAVCDDIVLECTQLAKQIRHIASQTGHEIILREFYTGKEFLQSAESFDILFLDIKMPGLDGMELARLLRNREETCHSRTAYKSPYPRGGKTAQGIHGISLSLLTAPCPKNSLKGYYIYGGQGKTSFDATRDIWST